MMIRYLKAELAIDSRDKIGEGPTWDAEKGRLLWSDHVAGIVHEARPDGSGQWHETHRWNLGRPLAATIPRAKGGIIVASGTDILTLDEAGGLAPFASIETDVH